MFLSYFAFDASQESIGVESKLKIYIPSNHPVKAITSSAETPLYIQAGFIIFIVKFDFKTMISSTILEDIKLLSAL